MQLTTSCRPYGAGLAASLLAGCGGAELAPPTLRIEATEYAFELPAEVQAGPTRVLLVNRGSEVHHAELVRFAEGKGMTELLVVAEGPGPAWAQSLGGPPGTMPGDSNAVVLMLEPGEYGLLCYVPDSAGVLHLARGMTREFTVGPATNGATSPVPDGELRLVDYGFERAPGTLVAGRHLLRVVNAAEQVHEVVMMRVLPGHTADEFLPWLEARSGPPPVTIDGGVSGLAPGRDALTEVELVPGTYLLICFVGDATDGRPHFVHGMMQEVVVD